jgi:sugar lactone lactonase YvrE
MGTLATRAALVLIAILVTSCASQTVVDPFGGGGRVWPEAPSLERIEFVTEFSSLTDLGARPSTWRKILNMAAGRQVDAMVRPMAVATTGDGQIIFVADPDAHCVHRYDLQRSIYTCLSIKGDEMLSSPVGLTVTDDGRLFVSDSQLGRVYQVAAGKKWLEPFDLQDALQQPTGLFWDSSVKLLYVIDTGDQSIKVFSPTGVLVREFSERGSQPGQLNFPTYLWVDAGGELLVTDSLNFRVQRFDRDGTYLETFGSVGDQAGDFARPKGVATDSFGHVYVIDALFHSIQIFDRHGTLLLSIGGLGHDKGQFWLPNGIFISPDNTIFVTDSYNKRVQVFRYIGPEI